jgi:uncharacterized protein
MSDLMGPARRKQRFWRRSFLAALALLITGFVALNVVAYRQAHEMMHFAQGGSRTGKPEKLSFPGKIKVLFSGVNLPRPHATVGPEVVGTGCQRITINCPNDIRLGAWYCPATTNAPVVILFHGYGSDKSGTISESRAFLEMGLAVLLVDFRGSGDSSESYTTVGFLEAEDVAASVAYARQQLHHSRIILYGQSMGAAAVLRAIHSYGVRPDAVIAEAVFDTMLHTVQHRFKAMGVPSFPSAELLICWGGVQNGFNGFKHNPVDYAASVRCPILFLHGTADPRDRVEEARRVFRSAPGR